MVHEDALIRIRFRIKELDFELQELRSAERVLLRLGESAAEKEAIPKKANEAKVVKARREFETLTEAVRHAVSVTNPSKAGNIVAWVRENYDPEAKPHSIRSMLSAWKTAGKLTLDDEEWKLIK